MLLIVARLFFFFFDCLLVLFNDIVDIAHMLLIVARLFFFFLVYFPLSAASQGSLPQVSPSQSSPSTSPARRRCSQSKVCSSSWAARTWQGLAGSNSRRTCVEFSKSSARQCSSSVLTNDWALLMIWISSLTALHLRYPAVD